MAEPRVTNDTEIEKARFTAASGLSTDGKLTPDSDANELEGRQHGPLDAAEEKKLLRRVDWHLLPLLSIMYVVKTIDAQNVSSLSFGPVSNITRSRGQQNLTISRLSMHA